MNEPNFSDPSNYTPLERVIHDASNQLSGLTPSPITKALDTPNPLADLVGSFFNRLVYVHSMARHEALLITQTYVEGIMKGKGA